MCGIWLVIDCSCSVVCDWPHSHTLVSLMSFLMKLKVVGLNLLPGIPLSELVQGHIVDLERACEIPLEANWGALC